jgi:ParB-like chromosome segregation protein Spo0J
MQTTSILIPPGQITARQYAGRDKAIVHGVPVCDPVIVDNIAAAYDPRLFEPVKVCAMPGGRYELVDGHHRFAAALVLGLDAIPALVIESTGEADRLGLQVAANNARAKDDPETLGSCFIQLMAAGKTEAQAAADIGVKLATARKYKALAQAPEALREWHRDGSLPLEVVAMICDKPIAPGSMRKLAELYRREKAQRPKFKPEGFRLYVDEFTRQLLERKPAAVQSLLINEDEDADESAAIERADKAVARRRVLDFENQVKAGLEALADPDVAAAIFARLDDSSFAAAMRFRDKGVAA